MALGRPDRGSAGAGRAELSPVVRRARPAFRPDRRGVPAADAACSAPSAGAGALRCLLGAAGPGAGQALAHPAGPGAVRRRRRARVPAAELAVVLGDRRRPGHGRPQVRLAGRGRRVGPDLCRDGECAGRARRPHRNRSERQPVRRPRRPRHRHAGHLTGGRRRDPRLPDTGTDLAELPPVPAWPGRVPGGVRRRGRNPLGL